MLYHERTVEKTTTTYTYITDFHSLIAARSQLTTVDECISRRTAGWMGGAGQRWVGWKDIYIAFGL